MDSRRFRTLIIFMIVVFFPVIVIYIIVTLTTVKGHKNKKRSYSSMDRTQVS